MAKRAVQATPPPAASRGSQMRAFAASHKGEEFTATALAKALGWIKRKTRRIRGEDGKATEDTVKISHNAKAAVRLARKCGAKVSHERRPKATANAEAIGRYTITL